MATTPPVKKVEDPGKDKPAVSNLEEQIAENVEALTQLRAKAEEDVDRHQRLVETIAQFVSRPHFLYFLLVAGGLWIGVNLLLIKTGREPLDEPPFFWLQGIVACSSLLLTVVLVTRQKRQGQLMAQQDELNLQVDMLAEQKTTKIISLLEELRRDLPIVQNRKDPEAEALQKPASASVVTEALSETKKDPKKKT